MTALLRFKLWILLGVVAAAVITTGPHLLGHHIHDDVPLCPMCLLAAGAFDTARPAPSTTPPTVFVALLPIVEAHPASQDPAPSRATRAPPLV